MDSLPVTTLTMASMPKLMVLDMNTKYTDMVVFVGEEKEMIPCHKAIVCQYSAVIATAIEAKFESKETGEFHFTDKCANIDNVRQFLLALYNPWDSEMDKFVHDIYRLAVVYQTPKVLDLCTTALGQLLTVENLWKTATVYEGHTCAELTAECLQFLDTQPQSIIDGLLAPTNEEYIAAQAHPSVVMPITVDALRRTRGGREIVPGSVVKPVSLWRGRLFGHVTEVTAHK